MPRCKSEEKIELEILKTKGIKGLKEYRKSKRIPLNLPQNKIIESKKYKQKYKEINEDD